MHTISQLTDLDPKATTGRTRGLANAPSETQAKEGPPEPAVSAAAMSPSEGSLQLAVSREPVLAASEEIVEAVYAGVRGGRALVDLDVTLQLDFPMDVKSLADSVRNAKSIDAAILKLAEPARPYEEDGPIAVSEEAIGAARWLVGNLHSLRGVLPDTVTALDEGGVELEFENPWIYFDIWVFGPKKVRFVARRGDTTEHGEGPVYEILDKLWKAIARASRSHQT